MNLSHMEDQTMLPCHKKLGRLKVINRTFSNKKSSNLSILCSSNFPKFDLDAKTNFKAIGPLVPENIFFKVLPYMDKAAMLGFVRLAPRGSIWNLVTNDPVDF